MPQIVDISNTEHDLVVKAYQDYGETLQVTESILDLFEIFIEGLGPSFQVFMLFYVQLVNSLTMALLSKIRLHDIQAMMMIRQFLESVSLAAYAIVESDPKMFIISLEDGTVKPNEKGKEKAYKWMKQSHPEISSSIKSMKDLINGFMAHSNALNGILNFGWEDEALIELFLFDKSQNDWIEQVIWWIGRLAISAFEILNTVRVGYDDVFRVNPAFIDIITPLDVKNMEIGKRLNPKSNEHSNHL